MAASSAFISFPILLYEGWVLLASVDGLWKECFAEVTNRPSQLNLYLLNLLGFVGLFLQYLNHVEVTKCYAVFPLL